MGTSGCLGHPDAVGVQFYEPDSRLFSQGDDPGQVVAHRGFAPGNLDIAARGIFRHSLKGAFDVLQKISYLDTYQAP